MRLGRILVRGAPAKVLGDALVIETYLGTNDHIINRSTTRRAPRAPKLVATG